MHNTILQTIIAQITPPAQFPSWLIPILAFILPIIYNKILGSMTGAIKFIIAAAISGAVAIGAIIASGTALNWHNWLNIFYLLFTFTQFVYNLMIKPLAKKLARKNSTAI